MDYAADSATDTKDRDLKPAKKKGKVLAPGEKANLAEAMNEEELKVIATKCRARYDRDLSSRAKRMRKLELIQRMYALVAEPKSFPFQNAANIKTPGLTGPVLQIEARLFDMVWPMTGRVFTVIPSTAADNQFASVAERFANTYVRYAMPYMAQGMSDTLHQMCLYGSAFRRTYWDGFSRKVRSDWIPMEDFVVAYKTRSQDPSLSDVPRYTMIHHMSLFDLRGYEAEGVYTNTGKLKKGTTGDDVSPSAFKTMSDRIDGQSTSDDESDDDDDMPRQVLEQHCRWKLPNKPKKHPAFDGREHYVVITIDAWSNTVLRISLREEDDPDDRRRFEREQSNYEQYLAQLDAFAATQQMQALGLPPMPSPDMMGGPPPEMGGPPPGPGMEGPPPPDPGMAMEGMQGAPPMPPAPPPPPAEPPEPMDPPVPIRKRQICFFTHYRCFASDGFYGLGYGDLTYGLALGVNTILNQHIDGATIRNAKPMFVSKQLRMQRGAVAVQPGAVIEVDAPAQMIRDAIVFLDPPQNDPTTMSLVKLLDGMKDSMVGSADLMSGQIPGSNQTKGGLQILSEQATMPITVLARHTRESFRHELDKMWRCWGVFLEDDDVADVVGEGDVPQQVPIGKWMFSQSARLVPASDPRMKSQRQEDHKMLMDYWMASPLNQDPQIGPMVMKKITEDGFRIFPDGEKLIPLLSPPPPPPPQPMPQYAENAGFMRGEDHPVLPQDDHDQHLEELLMFRESPDYAMLSPQGKEFAENHLRGHIAARMQNAGEQLHAAGPNGENGAPLAGGGEPPGFGPMEGPVDNQAFPGVPPS